MTSQERVLGQLEEFKKWATSEFKESKKMQMLIIAKLDKLNHERGILYGKITVINAVMMVLIQFVTRRMG